MSGSTFPTKIGAYDKHINCSLVDSQGNIWFGTNKGLILFDGHSWEVFADDETHPAVEVLEIIEDQDGNIWTVTKNNLLLVYQSGQWEQKDLAEISVVPGDYRTIFPDSQNRVWLISQSAIGCFSGEKWVSFGNVLDDVEILEMKKVIKSTFYNLDKRLLIEEGADGLLWLAHLSGVSYYDGKSWKTYTAGIELPKKWQVHSFYPAIDGHIYTGTFKSDGVIYKLGKDQVEKIPIKGEKFMVSIFQDSNRNLWVSGSKGVFRIAEGENQSEVFQKPSMGYMYHDAFEDSSGTIWFGMQGFKSRVLMYTPAEAKIN
jgi:ligand-binding sensor domain-containing protein